MVQIAAAARLSLQQKLQQREPAAVEKGRQRQLQMARSHRPKCPSPHPRRSAERCRKHSGQPKQQQKVALPLLLLLAAAAVQTAQQHQALDGPLGPLGLRALAARAQLGLTGLAKPQMLLATPQMEVQAVLVSRLALLLGQEQQQGRLLLPLLLATKRVGR